MATVSVLAVTGFDDGSIVAGRIVPFLLLSVLNLFKPFRSSPVRVLFGHLNHR